MSGMLHSARRALGRGLRDARRVGGSAVDLLRRGDRVVLCPPAAGLRLGNLLYLWLQAHQRSAAGENVVVRDARGSADWVREFPALRPLGVAPEDIRFSDRREWDAAWLYQRFGVDFSREQLHAFIRDVFAARVPAAPDGRLLLNVRRGDFYGTAFESKHGFDVVPYVDAALEQFDDVPGILVVSDDAGWCRTHLGDLMARRTSDVEYADPHPLDNLLALAGADRIIGANSTFSYWGAYIADALHEDARIVMPRFHARMAHGSDAHQLDPHWIALDGFH